MDLDSLINRCKHGDDEAWEALVRRLQGRIFAVCLHYMQEREEAREMAQETFIRIYRGMRGFDSAGSFVAWSVRIGRNACLDRLRALQRTPTRGAAPLEDLRGGGPMADVESIAERQARHDLLRKALDAMTALNREIILLKDIQGLTQQEIADLLAVPLGTVKTRSSRARRELAVRMLELDPTYGAG